MKTLGWLAIFAAIYLIRAIFRGQVLDEQGNFVLLTNVGNDLSAIITGKDSELSSGSPTGLLVPTPVTALPTATGQSGPTGSSSNSDGPVPNQWAKNPRSVQDALAWCASQQASGPPVWYRRCLAMCARAYGLTGSGTMFAIDIWSQMPSEMKHTGTSGIPTGALLLYRTGGRAGHIAIYAGNGMVYSTDILRIGRVDKVKFTELTNGKWKLHYVGWTPPYFPRNSNSKRVSGD